MSAKLIRLAKIIQKGGSQQLFQKTLHDCIKNNMPVVALFHADWCGHCKAFEPVWKALVSQASDKIKLISTNDENIHEKYNIKSYPTIRIYVNGNTIEYKGSREMTTLIDYINSVVNFNAIDINNAIKTKTKTKKYLTNKYYE